MKRMRSCIVTGIGMFLLIGLLCVIQPIDILVKCSDAVVLIKGTTGEGSGVLIKPNIILTAAHVIKEDTEFLVKFKNFETKVNRKFIDVENDVGLLILDKTVNIAPLRFRKNSVIVGMEVYCIGNPFGSRYGLEWTITKGIVSGKTRSRQSVTDLIQSDAAAYSGNSGSPLIDRNGRICGMIVYGYSDNLILCVSVKKIKQSILKWRTYGKV